MLNTIGQTYEEWMAARRYSVLRNKKTGLVFSDSVVASGLGLEAATALRDRLAADYRADHPTVSSFSGDVFVLRLETPKWELDPRYRRAAD